MESEREETTQPDVWEEDSAEWDLQPEADLEAESQDEEYFGSDSWDDEDVVSDVRGEERPAPAHRSVTIRLDLLVTLVIGLLLGAALGYAGRPLLSPQPEAPAAAASALETDLPTVPAVAATLETDGSAAASSETANSAADSADVQQLMDTLIAQTRHFKGDPNAPVTIIEFSDFQCPYCGRFAATAAKQIDEQYVQEGLVRVGYQHFAFLGQESEWAAQASECAAEQDAFWEYHDLLFASQAGENQGAFSKENLKQFAGDLGLDTTAFSTCLDAEPDMSTIRSEKATAQSLGVRGTPAFLVNGQPLVGAQPFEVFQQVIDSKLDGDSSEATP